MKDESTMQVNVRLPKSTADRVLAIATAEERSAGQVVHRLIRIALANSKDAEA